MGSGSSKKNKETATKSTGNNTSENAKSYTTVKKNESNSHDSTEEKKKRKYWRKNQMQCQSRQLWPKKPNRLRYAKKLTNSDHLSWMETDLSELMGGLELSDDPCVWEQYVDDLICKRKPEITPEKEMSRREHIYPYFLSLVSEDLAGCQNRRNSDDIRARYKWMPGMSVTTSEIMVGGYWGQKRNVLLGREKVIQMIHSYIDDTVKRTCSIGTCRFSRSGKICLIAYTVKQCLTNKKYKVIIISVERMRGTEILEIQ
ncbi:unnamed protein product [Mytilus edulis]|uniref:Uncharacterized protein n=1 Tax=Mytilus edulis TaxID=6550 RepID=A0A8S3USH3_MYTED|nr:unnamed protein product [Mytilus edulis]